MIKLLAVDMDGTCLDPLSRFSSQNLAALYRAKAAGIEIVPTTGRALDCLPHVLKAHPDLFRYVIASNGALVRDMRRGQDVFHTRIPPYLVEEIIDAFQDTSVKPAAHIAGQYWVHGQWMKAQGRLVFGKDAKQSKAAGNLYDVLREQKAYVEEIQLYFLSPKQKRLVQKKLGGLVELHAAYTSAYVEIFDQNSSKGKALQRLARHLGLQTGEIACVGDGENDVFMFHVAGMSFAMGNAKPAVKKEADFVTGTNREHGVAQAVDRILHTMP
ncbi:HAD family hydrolase [uncultured Dubosiella sp.]|uniref:HAD family hydrolase n=1 Tax=uncultured Dubosiella sp. TaxID=1937011 RepID=UPI0025B529AF|nr:HAD family hydrolase [uncultured Dubosiella sp.]